MGLTMTTPEPTTETVDRRNRALIGDDVFRLTLIEEILSQSIQRLVELAVGFTLVKPVL